MKNSIAVFAIIAVAAVSIGITGVSANSLMTASVLPEMNTKSFMMGHLEYTLVDENGNVKTYGQTDNFITTAGDRCIAELLFEPGSGDTSNAACNTAAFGVIGISNQTFTAGDAQSMNDEQPATGQVGIMATVNATSINLSNPAVDTEDGFTLVTAELSNSGHPFVFQTDGSPSNSSQTSAQAELAYLLQSNCQGVETDGSCDAVPGGDILASQSLSDLSVSDGDSLTITWTVTIGADGS